MTIPLAGRLGPVGVGYMPLSLPDGTEAQLRYMVPVEELVNYGPYWEGTFDKGGYLSVFLGQDGKSIAKQALSTMVHVEER